MKVVPRTRANFWRSLSYALPVFVVAAFLVLAWVSQADGGVTDVEHTHTYTDRVYRRIDRVEHQTVYSKESRPWCRVRQFDVQYTCDDQDNPYVSQWGTYLGHRTRVHVVWSCSTEEGQGHSNRYPSGTKTHVYDFPAGGGYNKGTHSWSSFSIPSVPSGWSDPCRWEETHTPTTTTTTTAAPSEPTTTTSTTTPPRLCGEGWFWDGVRCARVQQPGASAPPPSSTTTTTLYEGPLAGSWSGACAYTWRVGDTVAAGGLFDADDIASHRQFTGQRLPIYGNPHGNLYRFDGSAPSGMRWTLLNNVTTFRNFGGVAGGRYRCLGFADK